MDANHRPVFGFTQPAIGFTAGIDFMSMKGKKKTPKVPGFMRSVLARNIGALIARDYKSLPNITLQQKRLASEAGVSFSTVQRIMNGETGASLDNIESIAEVFDVSVYQLLLPLLDVGNPQIVKGASEQERRFYRIWRRDKIANPDATKEEEELG